MHFVDAYQAECVFPYADRKEDRSGEFEDAGSGLCVPEDEAVCRFVGQGTSAHDDFRDVNLDGDTVGGGGVRVGEAEGAGQVG